MTTLLNTPWPTNIPEDLPEEDSRNIADIYKGMSHEWILNDLSAKRLPYVVLTENDGGPNSGLIIRNANAFLANAIYLCGRKHWDRRTAVGANHYENIRFAPYPGIILSQYKEQGYRIVAIDNIDEATPINTYKWHEKSLLIFGQEANGISEEALSLADDIVYIRQYGSVRSLNVGCASAIAMHSYITKVFL